MTSRVAVIIPALNEEQTVGQVVSTVLESALVDEVYVVSDGSRDQTVSRARLAGATVFERARTYGKGQALLFALSRTKADVLLFLDADLLGLTVDHIEQLLLPVLTGSRVMNIGLRDRGAFIAKITHHLPLISGERALRREVVESIPPELMQGFMIETALNFTCRARGYAYGAVMLRDLRIRRKYEKVGYVRGVLQYIRMVYEVLLAHVAVRLVK